MGVFDSFFVPYQGKEVEVQSKQFARVLAEYRLGDFVEIDHSLVHEVQAFVENMYLPDSHPRWCVLLLFNNCFVDYLICDEEAVALNATVVMTAMWQQPERQVAAMLKFAQQHFRMRRKSE